MNVIKEETEKKVPTPMKLVEQIRSMQRVDWDSKDSNSFAGTAGRLIDKEYKSDNASALVVLKTINEMAYKEFGDNITPPSVNAILRISAQIELYE